MTHRAVTFPPHSQYPNFISQIIFLAAPCPLHPYSAQHIPPEPSQQPPLRKCSLHRPPILHKPPESACSSVWGLSSMPCTSQRSRLQGSAHLHMSHTLSLPQPCVPPLHPVHHTHTAAALTTLFYCDDLLTCPHLVINSLRAGTSPALSPVYPTPRPAPRHTSHT